MPVLTDSQRCPARAGRALPIALFCAVHALGIPRLAVGQRTAPVWKPYTPQFIQESCCSRGMFDQGAATFGLAAGYVSGLLAYRAVGDGTGTQRGLVIGAAVSLGVTGGVAFGHRRHLDRPGAWRWALLGASVVALPLALAPPCGKRDSADCAVWGVPAIALFSAGAANLAYSIAGH